MLVQQRAKIHSVKLIAAENEVIIVGPFEEVANVLPHGVGRALVPLRACWSLLRGEYLDEAAREIIELVGRLDVAMQ